MVNIAAIMQLMSTENSRSVSPFPVDPAWDQAFLRVESYLRAHHLESRVLLNQIATEIIREARERQLSNPGEDPIAAAMHVTHAKIGNWFARAGHIADWSDARVRARSRLALVLGDLPGRWANYFLAEEPVPGDLSSALGSAVLRPGPELRISNMPPAPLEFGFDDPDKPSFPQKGGWLILREAAGWLLVVGLYGAAWAASH